MSIGTKTVTCEITDHDLAKLGGHAHVLAVRMLLGRAGFKFKNTIPIGQFQSWYDPKECTTRFRQTYKVDSDE